MRTAGKARKARTRKGGKGAAAKTPRQTSAGSLASNLHEGSRSEYLAQYVFSSFGTAVPVPHQEDTGIDLYCTLLERKGQRAWPRAHYSVQVKSTMKPWVFEGRESVRWIIEHPLPIFLCVVDKKEARIRLYHTTPRFAAWVLPIHEDRLELVPGTETRARPIEGGWTRGSRFHLKAPILNFTIQEALDDGFRAKLASVLQFWIDNDAENIFRIKCGNHHLRMPHEYETNRPGSLGGTGELGAPFSEQSVQRAESVVMELLGHLATHYRVNNDLVSAAIYATALRRLCPSPPRPGEFHPHDMLLHAELNSRIPTPSHHYAFSAVDGLRQLLIDELAKHDIVDTKR